MKRPADGSTLLIRAFRVLRDVGSFDCEGLAAALDINKNNAWSAVKRLIERGCAERVMRTRTRIVPYPPDQSKMMARKYEWAIYRALPGKREPRDRRGRPKGSRNGTYANWLAAMRGKMGPAWRPKPKPAIALEEAWPRR